MLPWLALALAVIFLDQLTKIVIERTFEYGDVAAGDRLLQPGADLQQGRGVLVPGQAPAAGRTSS